MSDKPASPARGRKKTAPPAQQPPQEEVVVRLPLADLYPFPDHPFQVRDDEEMRETIQSVKEYGVIVPAIVRPREEGGYEIVAGHRRKYACEQAGLDTMPVLIRNLDRDAATIIMVDSNLQRENILPSERAKAYKMKLEAIKRQGARNDLTSPKISAKLRSDDEIGQQMGVSGDTVRNYISLTNLVPELMQMVDEKKIALSPAYQIAALKPEEQQMLAVGRAMMAKPRLLLLDEPSLGLAPLVIKEIFDMIDKIRDMGTTILLVEQNARVALRHSDRAYVLETGRIVLSDTAQALLNSDMVRKAYLGGL